MKLNRDNCLSRSILLIESDSAVTQPKAVFFIQNVDCRSFIKNI